METTILQYKDAFTAEEQQYYDAVTKDASGSVSLRICLFYALCIQS